MEVSGPCLILFHNGKECKLWEVTTTRKDMTGYHCKHYMFEDEEMAEIYTEYLYQVAGVQYLKQILASKKVPEYEKKDYRAFYESLDLTRLENLVKQFNPIVETKFYPHLKRKDSENLCDCEDFI